MKKELNMVKELVQEGKLQEAVLKLQDILVNSDNRELEILFTDTYSNNEMLKELQEIDGENFEYILDVDLEAEEGEYFYENVENEIRIKEITAETILNTIEKAENILKIA